MTTTKRAPTTLRAAAATLACALSACATPAFLSVDPWPAQMPEEQSDAWLSGGRYSEGAIEPGDAVGSQPARSGGDHQNGKAAQATGAKPPLGRHETAPQGSEPLLAWDGDVVDGPKRGEVVERDDPARGLDPAPEGQRVFLLQLYQDVLDERDHLADEVRALQKALGEAQARLDETSASTTGLSNRLEALAAEVERLGAENDDLAARLATAQIRRLEAEKFLLEARIDWYRSTAQAEPAELGAGDFDPRGANGASGGTGRRE